jgi:hypothetical protein
MPREASSRVAVLAVASTLLLTTQPLSAGIKECDQGFAIDAAPERLERLEHCVRSLEQRQELIGAILSNLCQFVRSLATESQDSSMVREAITLCEGTHLLGP